MDVRFEFGNLSREKVKKLAGSKPLSAFFDRVSFREAAMRGKTSYGESTVRGLVESYGLLGGWTIGIVGRGDIDDAWDGFSGHAAAKIEPVGSGIYVRVDGGRMSAASLIEMAGGLIQLLTVQSTASVSLGVNGGVPVEVYYRPPISYYDNFQLSQMDKDTLSQLERRLIE